MEDIDRGVSWLASLIVAHNKRIRAYLSIAHKATKEDIKSLCLRQVDLSRQFVGNLSTWRSAFGGFSRIDDQAGSNSIMQQLIQLFGFAFGKTVIDQCEQLERETLRAYKSALPFIPPSAVDDLQKQMKEIEKTLKRLHELARNTEVVGSLATR